MKQQPSAIAHSLASRPAGSSSCPRPANGLPALFMATVLLLVAGCSSTSMLPMAKTHAESRWESFEQAKDAFDRIIPYQTTRADLEALHFDPMRTPNITILTYLDIIKLFMPNSSIRLQDMDRGLQECVAAGGKCQAYRINLQKLEAQRYGNVFLDLFRFKRKAHQTGWNFSAVVVMIDDLVVYKIWGGQPKIDEYLYRKNPLGPLQEPAEVAKDTAVITAF